MDWNYVAREVVMRAFGSHAARHRELSVLLSPDDDPAKPDDFLYDLALKLVQESRRTNLADIAQRDGRNREFVQVWPGENYRMLAALVRLLQPKTVIELGTDAGWGALALKKYLPAGGKVATFDIVPCCLSTH